MKTARVALVAVSLLCFLASSAVAADARPIPDLAADALVAGQYGVAADLAEKAVRAAPASVEVYLVLGVALDHLGHHAAAADAYRVVARLSADRYRSLLLLGRALKRSGDVAQAVEVFDAAHALRRTPVTTAAR